MPWKNINLLVILGVATLLLTTMAIGSASSHALEQATLAPQSLPGSISGRVTTFDATIPLTQVAVLGNGTNGSIAATLTTEDGSYLLRNLVPDTYTVTVIIPGYEDGVRAGNLLASGQQVTGIDLRLRRESRISGIVTQSDGITPIIGANVLASGQRGQLGAAVTAADGSYLIQGLVLPGIYQLQVTKEGSGFPHRDVQIPEVGGDLTRVDFAAYGGLISGRVTKEDGVIPIAGATVYAEIDATSEVTTSLQIPTTVTRTQSDGSYRLENLQPVTYTLQTVAPGFGIEIRSVRIQSGIQTTETNFRMKPAGSISGRVAEVGDRKPVSGIKLSVLDSSYHVVQVPGEIVTGLNGEYTISGLAEGNYTVVANMTASVFLIRTTVGVLAGHEAKDVDFLVQKARGTIKGAVYQADSVTPVTQALIFAISDTTAGSAYTNNAGVFALTDLPVGTYSVVITAQGFDTQSPSGISVSDGMTTNLGSVFLKFQ